jgi:hypothetical protein
VLAGHSFGGLYIQLRREFPDDVSGVVLLDSTAPKPHSVPPRQTGSDDAIGRVAALVPEVAHVGAGRLIAPVLLWQSAATHPGRGGRQRIDRALPCEHQAASLTNLNGKPLIVLTADEGINDDQWQAKQDRMATLSTNSFHRHTNATLESLSDDEAVSAAASQAIHDAVRTCQPLASR